MKKMTLSFLWLRCQPKKVDGKLWYPCVDAVSWQILWKNIRLISWINLVYMYIKHPLKFTGSFVSKTSINSLELKYIKLRFLIIGCPRSSLYTKTDLTSQPVLCTISSKCTEVRCCVAVSPISRNFAAYIDIDPCNHRMTVGIEDYKTNVNLLSYTYGKY